jgi:aspartate-semialdehyde dehydrogenase
MVTKQIKMYDIAVVGATGAIGETILTLLEERKFPVGKMYPLASARSAGATLLFKKKAVLVTDVAEFDFSKVQIALFSAGGEVSGLYAAKAAEQGCIVIDNTSKFRLDSDVPLIIPEVNAHQIIDFDKRGIIANPNCSTIQMLVALKPIYDAVGITRINVATYQAVSGTGKSAVFELANQAGSLLNGTPITKEVYPKQIAFNVLPHIDKFEENGYTREEMKMVLETQKILNDPHIKVNPTAVRVPVFYGHSEAIHLETRQKISAADARHLLTAAPGIIVMDDPKTGSYPTPIPDASGTDAVYVGRIREDISHPLGLNLWVVADNIRKGGALNAIQIAEILINEYL